MEVNTFIIIPPLSLPTYVDFEVYCLFQ